jgi:RNA polymerase sigma-70 factor (ECF subfamily)
MRMIDEQAERQLVEGLRRDDRESLAAAYDAYGSMAYGLALHLLGSPSEAEDVVQESFLALWKQSQRLEPSRGVRSYLLSIVHNRAVDRVRRSVRRPETELDLDAPIPSNTDDPADEVARNLEREEVRAALVALSPDQRQTVEMVYFQGLTIGETANRMHVPEGTVKSRLRLALGHLRQELQGP